MLEDSVPTPTSNFSIIAQAAQAYWPTESKPRLPRHFLPGRELQRSRKQGPTSHFRKELESFLQYFQ